MLLAGLGQREREMGACGGREDGLDVHCSVGALGRVGGVRCGEVAVGSWRCEA